MVSDTMVIARVTAGRHWHALEDDVVVGRGHALRRPDGRVFVSVDSWADDVFAALAAAMLDDLAGPVYTVVDEDDREVTARWRGAGFRPWRREREYALATAGPSAGGPVLAGAALRPPVGVTVLPVGDADEEPLLELDRRVRAEVGAVGWQALPAEVLGRPGAVPVDPTRYAVAVREGRYVGLARVQQVPRRARLGLVAVLEDHRRQGVARALVAEVLRWLDGKGIDTLFVEVDERNGPARALFEELGARPVGGAVEFRHE